jgi:hypothetical protein
VLVFLRCLYNLQYSAFRLCLSSIASIVSSVLY